MEKFVLTVGVCIFFCLYGFTAINANQIEIPDEAPCEAGWVKIHRGCYMSVKTDMSWGDASSYCKEQNGELTSIQSWKEREELHKYLTANKAKVLKWWVGLHRLLPSGEDWKWQSDDPLNVNLINWVNPSLKSRPGKYCGLLEFDKDKFQVSVSRCSTEQPFICEYHSIIPRTTENTTSLTTNDVIGSRVSEPAVSPKDPGSKDYSSARTPTPSAIVPSAAVATSGTPPRSSTLTQSTTSTTFSTTTGKTSSTTVKPTSVSTTTESTTDERQETTKLITPTTTTSTPKTDNTVQKTQTTQANTRVTTTEATTPRPTQPVRTTPTTPRPTMVDWAKAFEEFHGCYVPGTGRSLRDTVMAARRFYSEGRTSCPEVEIGNVVYPATAAGETANATCARGNGFSRFQCGTVPLCWKGQPDINDCASKKLRVLLEKVEVSSPETNIPPPTIKESIDITSQLAEVTSVEETTMEDVLVASQVISSLTQVASSEDMTETKQVEVIVHNVVKAGSNLVSSEKSAMWEEMSEDDKVRSASTLLVAMETATVTMAEEIDEPTVIAQKDENIELELHVVDMDTLEKADKKELVYDSKESENTFSIPVETLKSVSKGNLAKAVFMTHYSMADILGGRSKKRTTPPADTAGKPTLPSAESGSEDGAAAEKDEDEEDEDDEVHDQTGPKIASYILSASLGVDGPITKLPKPVTFTMKHIEDIEAKYIPLCSFWNVSQDTHLGFWSQDGCRVLNSNKSYTTCECDHLTNFAILLDVHGLEVSETHKSLLRLVTIIGCIISSISLLASWISFQCFTSIQGERNSIHKNLAFTLLAAEILFVFGIDQFKHQIICSVIAGFLHFLFLAAFTWMFIEGLHIIFMLVQVFDASRSRLPYYYLTGYGVPATVVGVSCLFYYRGYGTDKYCWLTTDRYFIWAFAGPVAIILLVNAFFLTYAMSTVCRHSDYVFSSKEKTTGGGIRAWVQGALALEVLLGLTWTLGYFLITDESLPLAYIFAVMNSLQGLFIFVFHCLLNKKVQKEYRLVARKVTRRSPSSAATLSTFTRRTNNTNHSHDTNHSPSGSHQKLNVHSNCHSTA